jgi:hypothetical protein
MYYSPEISFISLGPSCAVEQNIVYRFKDRSGSVFDYNVCSIDGLIQCLDLYKNKQLAEAIGNINNYHNIGSVVENYGDKYVHKDIDLFSLYHEKNTNGLMGKIAHNIENLERESKKKYFVWSNIQSNVGWLMRFLGKDVSSIYLSQDNYKKIQDKVYEVFESEVIFVTKTNYFDSLILSNDNVYVIENPDIDSVYEGNNAYGDHQMFSKIFNKYIDMAKQIG